MTRPTDPIIIWAPSGTRVLPGSTQISTGWLPGQKPPSSFENYINYNFGQWLTWLVANTGVPPFGDGSDGAAVLDGVNTFSWASKVGNVYTLSRDVMLTDLTLSGPTITLKTANKAIYGTGTLTTNGGKITSNGGTTFTAVASGHFIGGTNGGTPATNGVGPAGTAQSASNYSGSGGNGGAGAGGAGGAGGGGGGVGGDTSPLHLYSPTTFGAVFFLGVLNAFGGGAGGGGGGGSGGALGVVGGSGAGVLGIAFRHVVLTDGTDLQANGTAGPNAVNNNTGGGGGGGGGTTLLVCETLTNAGTAISATTSAVGGAGGTGLGTGVAGSAGQNGTALTVKINV